MVAVRVRVLLMNTFGFAQLPCTHSLTPPSNSFCYCVSKYVYGVFLFFWRILVGVWVCVDLVSMTLTALVVTLVWRRRTTIALYLLSSKRVNETLLLSEGHIIPFIQRNAVVCVWVSFLSSGWCGECNRIGKPITKRCHDIYSCFFFIFFELSDLLTYRMSELSAYYNTFWAY